MNAWDEVQTNTFWSHMVPFPRQQRIRQHIHRFLDDPSVINVCEWSPGGFLSPRGGCRLSSRGDCAIILRPVMWGREIYCTPVYNESSGEHLGSVLPLMLKMVNAIVGKMLLTFNLTFLIPSLVSLLFAFRNPKIPLALTFWIDQHCCFPFDLMAAI